jgi:hypothetical protein
MVKRIKKKIVFKKLRARRISAHKKYLKNPNISRLNIDSHFIYDIDEGEFFYNKLKNKNLIKVNTNELKYLEEKIEEILITKDIVNKTEYIKIPLDSIYKITNYVTRNEIDNQLTNFIKLKFAESQNREGLTCRKLTKEYFDTTGIKTNRTTINKIIREKLGYKYLKTCLKNNIINTNDDRLIQFTFIKIVVKCLYKGFKLIFCDESGIMTKNNHYKCLRKPNEQIYNNIENTGRYNLIMAVGEDIIYFEIKRESTTETVFLEFMKNLIQCLGDIKCKNFVIILDNLSSHKTEKLIKFYAEKRVNIIFNAPLISQWNSIELSFRSLKKFLYSNIFCSMEELKENVKDFFENNEFKNTMKYNFGETLREYRDFIIKNKDFDMKMIKE